MAVAITGSDQATPATTLRRLKPLCPLQSVIINILSCYMCSRIILQHLISPNRLHISTLQSFTPTSPRTSMMNNSRTTPYASAVFYGSRRHTGCLFANLIS